MERLFSGTATFHTTRKKRTAWQDVERATEKRRELFQDILEDRHPDKMMKSGKKRQRKNQGEELQVEPGSAKIRKIMHKAEPATQLVFAKYTC